MQALDVVRLATTIAAVAASVSKILPFTLTFWEKFSPPLSRWLPGIVMVLGALPAALTGVTTWEQFALAMVGAVTIAMPGTHKNLAAPLKGPPVGDERVSLRPPPKAPSVPPLGLLALSLLGLLATSCGGSTPPPGAVQSLAPLVCQAALIQDKRFDAEQVARVCQDSALAAKLTEDLTRLVLRAADEALQPKLDVAPTPGPVEGGAGGGK